MTSLLPLPQTAISQRAEVVYPSSDGEPWAESYYVQGFPKFRVAPDVMVVFNVPPGARDNYKVWEEAQVPSVIFEMTSAGTKNRDEIVKKDLYESLDVPEYWQFDPKGEWIPEKLRGYRLQDGVYVPITDSRSEPLKLRLEVNEALIAFYREDNGEKLLASAELVQALRQETVARQEAEALLEQEQQRAEQERERAEQERERAEQERERADRLAARLRDLGEDPDLIWQFLNR